MDAAVEFAVASALSTFTAVAMMYAAYHWPVGHNKADDEAKIEKARHSIENVEVRRRKEYDRDERLSDKAEVRRRHDYDDPDED